LWLTDNCHILDAEPDSRRTEAGPHTLTYMLEKKATKNFPNSIPNKSPQPQRTSHLSRSTFFFPS
jgi:hypothetical protein